MLDRIEKRASALTADAFDDARLVAGEFDLFLDMLAEGSGSETSAAFLGPRRAGPTGRQPADAQDADTPRETRPTPPNVILRPGEAERGAPEEAEDTRPTLPIAPLYLASDSGSPAEEAAADEPFPPRVTNRAARRAAAARLRHR